MSIRVTVWGENVHEHTNATVARIYPKGMHATIAAALNQDARFEARTATLDQPEHGLSAAVLDQTDVLTWWGHTAHGKVDDAIAERVQERVLQGMGLIVLHSAHFSKIFKRLLGTSCALTWREVGERERLWVCNPGHPIAHGLPRSITIPNEEMYGEPFGIPNPDEVVLVSWFEGGEVFRSGCTFTRGAGRIFYFRPGHETYPTYHIAEIQQVLRNAVAWAAPTGTRWNDVLNAPNAAQPPEAIRTPDPNAGGESAGGTGFR